MCSFLVANWLISNLSFANFFLQPRGPDATNRWQGYGFDFVHNLLHMTGDRVLQPFHNEEAGIVALFNGEIYNWQDLQANEEVFRSDGDAIISEYMRHGRRFVRRLDGEFALALFDFARGEALFATDPFGTKPIWFARGAGGRLAVASYRSALERLGQEGMEISALEPNSAIVLALPSGLEDQVVNAATPPREAMTGQPMPQILAQFAVFEFDLRQHKTHTDDWKAAFFKAVDKRARVSRSVAGREQPAMCLSDGYDSGAIALALGRLGVEPAMYTVQAREDVRVLIARLRHLSSQGINATWSLSQLSLQDFESERHFLQQNAERVEYQLRPGYATVDDKAAAGLSWIYRQAADAGQRLFLSGTGADEIISDYGNSGEAFEFHSTLRGVFPEELLDAFPWLNFFKGTQRDYLAKEESAAGAHGVETRYPYLDRSLVQEYLWLDHERKNSVYKAPLHELLREESFPFVPGTKRGFSADKNLVGGEVDEGKNSNELAEAREKLWAAVHSSSSDIGLGHTCVVTCFGLDSTGGSSDGSNAFNETKSLWPGARRVHVALRELMSLVSTSTEPSAIGTIEGKSRARARAGRRRWLNFFTRRRDSDEMAARRWARRLAPHLHTFQKAEAAVAQTELAPPLSLASANGFEPRHRVVIMTSCMEEHYFWTYCGPMLTSFGEVFQLLGAGEQESLRVLVATAGVPESALEAVARVLPFVEFVGFHEHEEDLSSHSDPTEAENYRRLSYQSLKLRQYLRLWHGRLLDSKTVDYVVCMDSDMLAVRPFEHVFELLTQLRVDVAFSYYDGTRAVPWGSPEEVAFTKGKRYVRLQGGMLLMRNCWQALQWFALWTDLTKSALHYKEEDSPHGERWRDLLDEFKGPSQAALAFLLTQGDVETMKDARLCCSVVRTIHLEPLRSGEPEVPVSMFGLPTQYLNDAESTEDGSLPETAHVIHLKGTWWRNMLPDGNKDMETPTRSYEWNREAFLKWRRHYGLLVWLLHESGFELPVSDEA